MTLPENWPGTLVRIEEFQRRQTQVGQQDVVRRERGKLMPSPVALEYRELPEARPRWVTRLAITSIILGTLGIVAGVLRMRDAWMYVFEPTFRWIVPPHPAVPPLYLAAILAAIAVSALLMTAGIVSLIRPRLTARLHLLYAFCKLPLVAATATLRVLLISRNPAASSLVMEPVIECLLFGFYPAVVLWIVWRRTLSADPAVHST